MIVYLITNKINGKRYVGQSVSDDPRKRWYGHVWSSRDEASTHALARAFRKYGKEAFSMEVIDTASTIEELNIKEWFHAEMLGTYVPNGYNLAKCGFNKIKHPETVEKASKDWILLSPDNEIIRVRNLSAFCRERGLSASKMAIMLNGKRYSCGGWRNARRPNRTYHLIHVETGQKRDVIHAWGTGKEVANQLGITNAKLNNLLRGEVKEQNGWIVQGESLSPVAKEFEGIEWEPKERFKRRHREETVLKMSGTETKRLLNNTEMRVYEFTNVSRFAKQMGLQHALVINVLNGGKRSKHKRWSLPENPIKRFMVKNPKGEEIEIFDGEIKRFCRDNNLRSAQYFLEMLNQRRCQYVGWTLVRVYIPEVSSCEVIKLKQYDLPEANID